MFLWELKNAIISTNLRELCVIETPKPSRKIPLHSGFDKLSHRVIYYYSRCLSLLKARSYSSLWFRLRSITVLFITTLGAWACRRHILTSHLGAWACRRHIISIALKSVCFLEHLWCSFGNSKTQSFQQNLRELCVIETQKPSRKIPPFRVGEKNFPQQMPEPPEGTIISILLKSVCFLEHLWCSFGNSKTPSFQKLSVNFVL